MYVLIYARKYVLFRIEAGLLRSTKDSKQRGKSSSDEAKKLSAKQEKALEKKEKVKFDTIEFQNDGLWMMKRWR